MSSPRLPDVWYSRDLPVLLVVAGQLDRGEPFVEDWDVAAQLGWEVTTVQGAAQALRRRGLVRLIEVDSGDVTFNDVSGDAYPMTGLHPAPGDEAAALVEAFQIAAEQSTDPAQKSKLQQVAGLIGSLGTGVASGVATAYLRAWVGI